MDKKKELKEDLLKLKEESLQDFIEILQSVIGVSNEEILDDKTLFKNPNIINLLMDEFPIRNWKNYLKILKANDSVANDYFEEIIIANHLVMGYMVERKKPFDLTFFYRLVFSILRSLPEEFSPDKASYIIKKIEIEAVENVYSFERKHIKDTQEEIKKGKEQLIFESYEDRIEYLDKIIDSSFEEFGNVYTKLAKSKEKEFKEDDYVLKEERKSFLNDIFESSMNEFGEVYKNLA